MMSWVIQRLIKPITAAACVENASRGVMKASDSEETETDDEEEEKIDWEAENR
jgi:hypothetical protein